MVYDGACGFCGRFAAFVQRRDNRRAFAFEHLQGDAGKRLVNAKGADSGRLDTIYLVDGAGRLLARSTAVIFVMRCLGWPWSLVGAAAMVLPLRLRDAVYNGIARNRYLFGGACDMGSSETPTCQEAMARKKVNG